MYRLLCSLLLPDHIVLRWLLVAVTPVLRTGLILLLWLLAISAGSADPFFYLSRAYPAWSVRGWFTLVVLACCYFPAAGGILLPLPVTGGLLLLGVVAGGVVVPLFAYHPGARFATMPACRHYHYL